MEVHIPEPYKRPIGSLTLPGQRVAVERFIAGSEEETFEYQGSNIRIREDDGGFLKGRSPLVIVTNNDGKEMLSTCVQDTRTHIAHHVTDIIGGNQGKGFGSVARDTVEAITGIPPFETAKISYLIIFLIKRGYVPVGFIKYGSQMNEGHLYVDGLSFDEKLNRRDIETIIRNLSETYKAFKFFKAWPDSHIKEDRLLGIRAKSFGQRIRLQYNPEIAEKIYTILKSEILYFYNNIDEVIEAIEKVAYK